MIDGLSSCKYRATANPRHKVLPELKKIVNDNNLRDIVIYLISHNFEYDGYDPEDPWFKALYQILNNKGKVYLLGGMPSSKRLPALKTLHKLGASIRILNESPTTHIFIYTRKSKPVFIWFEKKHEDGKAKCIAYTRSPDSDDCNLATSYFMEVGKNGVPFEETEGYKDTTNVS